MSSSSDVSLRGVRYWILPSIDHLGRSLLSIARRHVVLFLYTGALLFLTASTWWSGTDTFSITQNTSKLAGLAIGIVVTYGLLWQLIGRRIAATYVWRTHAVGAKRTSVMLAVATGLYILLLLLHLSALKEIPLIASLQAQSDIDISIIRQEAYIGLPPWLRYVSDFSVKAIGPGLLLLTAYFKSRIFWIVAAVGSAYALALLPKIIPIFLFLPTILYFCFTSWRKAAGLTVVLLGILWALTVVQIVDIREAPLAPTPDIEDSATHAVGNRAFIVPGRSINQWFAFYRSEASRESGCGIRPLAFVLGCEYVSVPEKLYNHYYPEYAASGLRGNLNAASFMIDYANFGEAGLLLSMIGIAVVLVASAIIFSDHILAAPCNIALILALMETNLSTALLSGSGWLLTALAFFCIFRTRNSDAEKIPSI